MITSSWLLFLGDSIDSYSVPLLNLLLPGGEFAVSLINAIQYIIDIAIPMMQERRSMEASVQRDPDLEPMSVWLCSLAACGRTSFFVLVWRIVPVLEFVEGFYRTVEFLERESKTTGDSCMALFVAGAVLLAIVSLG